MVKGMGCTCVTISHRPALVAFHDLVLALDGEGGWSLHKGARSSPDGSDDAGFEALPSGKLSCHFCLLPTMQLSGSCQVWMAWESLPGSSRSHFCLGAGLNIAVSCQSLIEQE